MALGCVQVALSWRLYELNMEGIQLEGRTPFWMGGMVMECTIIVIRLGLMPNSLSLGHTTITQGKNISNSILSYRIYLLKILAPNLILEAMI